MKPILALIALALFTAATASGQANPCWPDTCPPNDPGYQDCQLQVPPCDFDRDQWMLFSFEPAGAPGAGVSGVSADLAWPITIGNPDVIIGVTDSGIEWDERELANQAHLNTGELPEPIGPDGNSTIGLYDINGDGRVNVLDYQDDPRVSDLNGNGFLDGQDLIRAFEDGVDDDGNAYTDDICGWDFMWNDNDPSDEVRDGHGTGMARRPVSETNNGQGLAGLSPGATFVPLRVGDGFIADVSRFGEAMAYAADNGHRVILDALGTLNNTEFAREATSYAFQRGVFLAASSADENSAHHNFPAFYKEALTVNALLFDCYGQDLDTCTTTTFLSHNNGTNYGGRIDMSFPAEADASGAVAYTSGAAALVISRGDDLYRAGVLSTPLTPLEAKAILKNTADDINEPFDPRIYPSQPGWDQFYGYGRFNMFRAVTSMDNGQVPPEVMITSPDWFRTLYAGRGQTFDLEGIVAANRAQSYTYEVQVAPGTQPLDADFNTVFTSGILDQPFEGVLATIDLAETRVDPNPPTTFYDQYSFTVRVRVFDSDGNFAEDRRNLFYHRDDDLHGAFPIDIGNSGESSPVLYDFDGDGASEIVLATAGGRVHVFRADGSELPGFPAEANIAPNLDPNMPGNHSGAPAYQSGALQPGLEPFISSVGVGDLDGDGTVEIAVGSLHGSLYVFNQDGSRRAGFPTSVDPSLLPPLQPGTQLELSFVSSPSLADLDGDGDLELIIASEDQHIYAWHDDGTPVQGWPVLASDGRRARIIASTAVDDIDGDGFAEVIVGSNERYNNNMRTRLYAFNHDGTLVSGWPAEVPAFLADILPRIGKGIPNSPMIVDINGTIAIGVAPVGGSVVLYNPDGTIRQGMASGNFGANSPATKDSGALTVISSPSAGDITGDGIPEIFMSTAGTNYLKAISDTKGQVVEYDHYLSAFNAADGTFLPAFPQIMEDLQFFMCPAVADITGDGMGEVIVGSGMYLLWAFDKNGTVPDGWPKHTGGWIIPSPAVGDIDGDGYLDVVTGTREGQLFAWRTDSPTFQNGELAVQWGSFGHDPRNTRSTRTTLTSTSPQFTPTPSPTPTVTPGPTGFSLLGGYAQTDLDSSQGGGLLTLLAWTPGYVVGDELDAISVQYQGVDLGITLTNQPPSGDPTWPEDLHGLWIDPLQATDAGTLLLELLPVSGTTGDLSPWPYLSVK